MTDTLLIANIGSPEQVPIPNGLRDVGFDFNVHLKQIWGFFMDGNGDLKNFQVTVFTQFNSLYKVELTVKKEMSLANHSLVWLTVSGRCGTQPGSGSH